ncbi:MAG: hypothetical protein J6584_04430 [Lactobacillus sp.]|nr:hypothetical protein [Lactobacillus sp.]
MITNHKIKPIKVSKCYIVLCIILAILGYAIIILQQSPQILLPNDLWSITSFILGKHYEGY